MGAPEPSRVAIGELVAERREQAEDHDAEALSGTLARTAG